MKWWKSTVTGAFALARPTDKLRWTSAAGLLRQHRSVRSKGFACSAPRDQLQAVPELREENCRAITEQVRSDELVLGPKPGNIGIVTRTRADAPAREYPPELVLRLFRRMHECSSSDSRRNLRSTNGVRALLLGRHLCPTPCRPAERPVVLLQSLYIRRKGRV